MPRPARFIVQEVVPAGETQVRPGEHVHALDGEIGLVQGLLVDPEDHRVTHVLLREGHLRGRKQVAIPVSAVTGIQDGIRLNITKQQVENLPPGTSITQARALPMVAICLRPLAQFTGAWAHRPRKRGPRQL
jgi:hypothetical protein